MHMQLCCVASGLVEVHSKTEYVYLTGSTDDSELRVYSVVISQRRRVVS